MKRGLVDLVNNIPSSLQNFPRPFGPPIVLCRHRSGQKSLFHRLFHGRHPQQPKSGRPGKFYSLSPERRSLRLFCRFRLHPPAGAPRPLSHFPGNKKPAFHWNVPEKAGFGKTRHCICEKVTSLHTTEIVAQASFLSINSRAAATARSSLSRE